MPWALRGLRDGVVTTGWPRRPDAYADGWPGAGRTCSPGDAPSRSTLRRSGCARPGPSGATPTAGWSLDRGRCILCGACVRDPPGPVRLGARRADRAAAPRSARRPPRRTTPTRRVDAVRAGLARRVRALRRSVHIRHVDAGSDGSEEWEVHALLNPVYDIHRLGIFFTASPRHADILLVTGAGGHRHGRPAAAHPGGDARAHRGHRGRHRRHQRRARPHRPTRSPAASATSCRWTCGCPARRPARSACCTAILLALGRVGPHRPERGSP